MQSRSRIKAVLFDSGDTLVRPIGGTWWPRPVFRRVALEMGLAFPDEAISAAHQSAMAYLDENHSLQTLEEEIEQFRMFYQLVFENLHVEVERNCLERLVKGSVHEAEFELFPDSVGVVEALRQTGLAVGIVSDAWPSLEFKYSGLGIRELFDPFVISAKVGSCKPAAAIFDAALEGLGMSAHEVLFVDDWPPNVAGAIERGLRGIVLARSGEGTQTLPQITQLCDVIRLVTADQHAT
jgi:putative hydrolase of the HAD superfamily